MSGPRRSWRSVVSGSVLALVGLGGSGAADQAPCQARVRVTPERAYVGEQVLYGLEIERSAAVRSMHWARPLAAPGFRVESLPTRTDLPPTRPHAHTQVIEERRALFPTRPGELEIPPARLRCTLVSEQEEREVDVTVPSARVWALPLPEAGRPPGFHGVVGSLEVLSQVEPAELELGEAASLTVVVEGRANLWELSAPFEPDRSPIPNVDLLARPSEIARDAGRALRLRRYFVYDVVPRAAGTVEVPEVRVPYFDPASDRFVVAKAPALRIEVHPAPGMGDVASTPAPPAPERREGRDPPSRAIARLAPWLAPGSAALVLVLWARSRRRRAPLRELRELFDRAAEQRAEGEIVRSNEMLARALRTVLEEHLPRARSLSAEELVTRAGDDPELLRVATLLCQLDGARFSAAPDRAPDPEAARRAALSVTGRRHHPGAPGGRRGGLRA